MCAGLNLCKLGIRASDHVKNSDDLYLNEITVSCNEARLIDCVTFSVFSYLRDRNLTKKLIKFEI